MMHVIVNWGGKIDYKLDRIYNLAQMMISNGYEVSLIEKDGSRQHWLLEHLGKQVPIKEAFRSKASHRAS